MNQFDNNRPIYIQLANLIRQKILSGDLMADARIPSVRDIALKYGVNPNTVQKALSLLEAENLLRSERTSGRFVNVDIDVIEEMRKKQIKALTVSYVDDMKHLGSRLSECIAIVRDSWREDSD